MLFSSAASPPAKEAPAAQGVSYPSTDGAAAGLAEGADRRTSAESFRLLFEGAPDAVFVGGVDGTVLEANLAAGRLYGISREEIIGRSLRELVLAEAAEEAVERFNRLVSGKITRVEGYSRRVDGSAVPVEVRASRFVFGGELALLLHVTDVSSGRQSEEQHQREREFSRLLVDSSFDGIIALDTELCCTVWNPAMERMTGLEKDVVLGRPVAEVLPFLAESDGEGQLRAALGGEHTVSIDRPYHLEQTGREGFFEAQTSPMQDESGEIVGVVCVVRDTTDRKLVARALRRSEERFAKVFEAAPVSMMITRLGSGRVVDANAAFSRLTGYAPGEVIGRKVNDLGLSVHRVLLDRVLDILQEGAPYGDVEAHVRHKDGGLREVISSGEFIEIGGEPCLLSMFYDITERKRLEREVLEIAEFERRRIGQDLHDGLGQQLTGIGFLARVVGRNLAQEAPEHVEQLDRIADLIAQAITYTRSLSRTLSPVDVQADGLQDALRRLAESTGEFSGLTCRLDADAFLRAGSNSAATHLYRIAQEALNNALKHAGAQSLAIELSRQDGQGVLRVRDDGRGLPESMDAHTSAGMGLRTMRYRANVIGGVLDVYGAEAGGTVVECRFPVG